MTPPEKDISLGADQLRNVAILLAISAIGANCADERSQAYWFFLSTAVAGAVGLLFHRVLFPENY